MKVFSDFCNDNFNQYGLNFIFTWEIGSYHKQVNMIDIFIKTLRIEKYHSIRKKINTSKQFWSKPFDWQQTTKNFFSVASFFFYNPLLKKKTQESSSLQRESSELSINTPASFRCRFTLILLLFILYINFN